MLLLGLHTSGWTTSAALFENATLIAACPEERLNRQKYSRLFPAQAIDFCLREAGASLKDVDHIAVGWNPGVNIAARYRGAFSERLRFAGEWLYSIPNHVFGRLIETSVLNTEQVFSLPGGELRFHHVNHHNSHAAMAYYCSPFDESAIFTVDGYGERTCTSWKTGRGNKISTQRDLHFPQSLGSLYSAITEFLGYEPDGDEWKVMGMSAYGDPERFRADLVKLYRLLPDGAYELDLTYFNHFSFDTRYLYSPKMLELLGDARQPGDELEQRHYDLAAGIQIVLEEILYHCLNHLHARTGSRNLCLSGGTIMNSVFNGKVIRNTPFEHVYIPFSPDDTGNAIGTPLLLYFDTFDNPRTPVNVDHPFFGPEFSNDEIEETLRRYGIPFRRSNSVVEETARAIAAGEVVGWFQGRMEFGQRALGNRSILADPRDARMKDRVNSAIKYRESFRPFAPSVIEEEAATYFDIEPQTSVPFMERVYEVHPHQRRRIPAVVHNDGTGRLQTVSRDRNPRYHALLEEFGRITGVPVILNTSFNVKGEPIVCSPTDAIRTFYTSGLDRLVLGDCVVGKEDQTSRSQQCLVNAEVGQT